MAQYTANENLYKWSTSDTKQTTITETALNADKIDTKLNSHGTLLTDHSTQLSGHTSQLAEIANVVISIDKYPRQTPEVSDSPRINRAIDDINSKGGGNLLLKSETYSVTGSVVLKEFVGIVGVGRGTVLRQDFNGTVISANGSLSATITTLTADVMTTIASYGGIPAQSVLTVTSTTGFSIDDYILLEDTEYWNPAFNQAKAKRGEYLRIKSVDSATQITVHGFIADSYQVSKSAKITKVNLLKGMSVNNLRIYNSKTDGSNNSNDMVIFRKTVGLTIDKVFIENADQAGIRLEDCIDFHINNPVIQDLKDSLVDPYHYGYGIVVGTASQNGLISNPIINKCRHAFTTDGNLNVAGVPRNITVSNGIATQATAPAWDTHPEGENINFINCTASQSYAAFQVRAKSSSINGGSGINCTYGIYFAGPATQFCQISNLSFSNINQYGIWFKYDSGWTGNSKPLIKVRNIELMNIGKAGILVDYMFPPLHIKGVDATNVGILGSDAMAIKLASTATSVEIYPHLIEDVVLKDTQVTPTSLSALRIDANLQGVYGFNIRAFGQVSGNKPVADNNPVGKNFIVDNYDQSAVYQTFVGSSYGNASQQNFGLIFPDANHNNIQSVGFVSMVAKATSSVPNNSYFIDIADNKLKFKDNAGVAQLLY